MCRVRETWDGSPVTVHDYDEKICAKCGTDFCWDCCGGTNVHEGGKHQPDYMNCPQCGHDWYKEITE